MCLVKSKVVYGSATDEILLIPSTSPYIALNVLSLKICCRKCSDYFRDQKFLEPFQHTRQEIQSALSWGLTDLHLVMPWSRTNPHDIHSLSPFIPTFRVLFIRVRNLFEKPKILPDFLTRCTRFQVLTVVIRGVLPIATRSLVAGKYRCFKTTCFLHLQGRRNLVYSTQWRNSLFQSRSFTYPEVGNTADPRNIDTSICMPSYTQSHSRRKVLSFLWIRFFLDHTGITNFFQTFKFYRSE